MSESSQICPDQSQLANLLDDTINIDITVAAHVEVCFQCQCKLDQLTDSAKLEHYLDHSRQRQQGVRFLEPPQRDGDLGWLDGLAIEEQIGIGGMGIVFRGWDDRLSRAVAVKILYRYASVDASARFRRESQAMARLEHDHVLPIYSVGHTRDNTPYLVMPLITGDSLRQRIKTGSLSPIDSAKLIQQIALGLDAAHQAGLIHRDVKPDNILFNQTDGRAKLTDFGLARSIEDKTLTQANIVAGTPHYMSPEQIDKPISADARSDVYSLGITLYECLTGSPPFSGQPLQILEQHRQTEPIRPSKLNPLVSRELDNICLMAIAKEPENRYQSARLFATDLECFRDGRPIAARETTRIAHLQMWCKRNRAMATMCVLLLSALILGTIGTSVMWYRSAQSAAEARQSANDLNTNRRRLRESVSRFQQRVFSEEAVHWQMTDKFRAEMFGDVVEFLDEFAALETFEQDDTNATDGLAQDYLVVAKAAFEVKQFADARDVAERSLVRLRVLNTNPQASSENLHMHFEASKLASIASRQSKESTTDAKMFAKECRSIAQNALQRFPADWTWKLADRESKFLLSASEDVIDATELARLRETHADISFVGDIRLPELELQALLILQDIGWYLAEKLPTADAIKVMDLNVERARPIRENIRQTEQPMASADFMQARNFAVLAVLLHKQADIDGAIENATSAQLAFKLGLGQRPQDRDWNLQALRLEVQLCDWQFENGNLDAAIEALKGAMMKLLLLSKSDPADFDQRVQIIKLFIKRADMLVRLGKHDEARESFFIVAQDCRLLLPSDEHRNWMMNIRPWVISKVVEQLSLAPNNEFEARLFELELTFIQRAQTDYDTDPTALIAALEGRLHPDRPTEFESEQITRAILASDK